MIQPELARRHDDRTTGRKRLCRPSQRGPQFQTLRRQIPAQGDIPAMPHLRDLSHCSIPPLRNATMDGGVRKHLVALGNQRGVRWAAPGTETCSSGRPIPPLPPRRPGGRRSRPGPCHPGGWNGAPDPAPSRGGGLPGPRRTWRGTASAEEHKVTSLATSPIARI